MRVDNNILKIDTVDPAYINKVDRPQQPSYDVQDIIEGMKAFNGHVIIQTMFMKGLSNGEDVSNVKEEYIKPWLEAVREIKPMELWCIPLTAKHLTTTYRRQPMRNLTPSATG
jgi:hypothetical protein